MALTVVMVLFAIVAYYKIELNVPEGSEKRLLQFACAALIIPGMAALWSGFLSNIAPPECR
jgi:hypothetical protein